MAAVHASKSSFNDGECTRYLSTLDLFDTCLKFSFLYKFLPFRRRSFEGTKSSGGIELESVVSSSSIYMRWICIDLLSLFWATLVVRSLGTRWVVEEISIASTELRSLLDAYHSLWCWALSSGDCRFSMKVLLARWSLALRACSTIQYSLFPLSNHLSLSSSRHIDRSNNNITTHHRTNLQPPERSR